MTSIFARSRVWVGVAAAGSMTLAGVLGGRACGSRQGSGHTTTVAAATSTDVNAQQQKLALSLEQLGDRQRDAGDLEAARTAYEGAKDIRLRLVKNSGLNDPASLRAAANSLTKLGAVILAATTFDQRDQAPYRESRELFESATVLHKQLVAAEPDNLGRQRDLATSYVNVAAALEAARDWRAELVASQTALDIRARLVEAAPFRSDLLRALQEIADKHANRLVQGATIIPSEAAHWERKSREAYEAALAVGIRLVQLDPGDLVSKRQLVMSYGNLGDAWRTEHRLKQACDTYAQTVPWIKQLQMTDRETQAIAADHLAKYAFCLLEKRKFGAAAKYMAASVELEQQPVQFESEEPLERARQLAFSFRTLGYVRAAAGQKAAAVSDYTNAYELVQKLKAAGDDTAKTEDELLETLGKLGARKRVPAKGDQQ